MYWIETPIHIIDFEGTLETGIIEYGITTLHQGQITQTYTRLCQAKQTITPYDTSRHGIKTIDTQASAPFEQDWPLFSELRMSGPFGAHHAITENGFIKNVWPYPKQVPDFSRVNQQHANWGPWVDTCCLYKNLFPGLKDYKLGSLIQKTNQQDALDQLAMKHCPKSRQAFHCALYDALASALLLNYLSTLEGCERITLPWILAKSSPSAKKQAAQVQQDLF